MLHSLQSDADWHKSVSAVPGIQPHRGWTLHWGEDEDSDGFWAPFYVAIRHDGRAKSLNLSRFSFRASQARWNWLVEHNFPDRHRYRSGVIGPLDSATIDRFIEIEARDAA